MPETVPIQYSDLFEFLEDYRTNLSQLQCTVPLAGTAVGDDVVVAVAVPVLGETVLLPGRVMAPMKDQAGLQLDPDAADGLPRLEGFYRFVGSLVEAMLVSGRFKVTGQWAEGAAPQIAAPVAGAPAAAASGPAPVAMGAATHNGKVTLGELTGLFMRLYAERATGILQIQGGVAVRRAFVKAGGIVAWEAEPVLEQECLGVLLVRAGRLQEEQLKKTLSMMNDTGMKQGECLIEMGVYTFPQIVMALMTQVEIVTRNVFTDLGGTWSFHPSPSLGRDFITPPMKSPGFLFKFFKKHFATIKQEEVEAIEGPLRDQYTKLQPANWDDFRLSKAERGLIEILAKHSYRYREVFRVSNVGRNLTSQILLTLIEMESLTFVDTEDVDQVAARWAKTLDRKLMLQRDQNPFELLEVHWTSRTPQIEEAYKRLVAEYEGFGRGKALPDNVETMRQKVLSNVHAAYAATGEKAARVATRKKHYEPQQHEFSADLLFKQGEMLMVRHMWDDVIEDFERAIELMPNVGKYRQFLKQALQKKRAGGGSSE